MHHKQIKVTTKSGAIYNLRYSDYFINDGFLTVYRKREFIPAGTYFNPEDKYLNPEEIHIFIDYVESIEVIE